MYDRVEAAGYCPSSLPALNHKHFVMKKLTLILFALLAAVTESRAVGDSLLRVNMAMDLQIRQKPGSEKLLAEYLNSLPAVLDTVYAIIYEPAQCPRCEASIHVDYAALKRVRPDAPMVLITLYPDSASAAAYNRKKGYIADGYIYDTEGAYRSIFSFNSASMIGTYILKMCRSTGQLLFGAESFNMGSNAFMRELTAWSGPMPARDYGVEGVGVDEAASLPVKPGCAPISGRYEDHTLSTGGEPLSEVYDVPKYDGNYFYYNDKLANGIMLFRDGGDSLRFVSKIEADSTEQDRFIELDEPLRSMRGDVYYIPCAASMLDGGRMGVSYSLPHLMLDTIAKNGGIAYFNKAVVLVRYVSTGKPLPMFVPDFDMADTLFFYKHFTFTTFKGEAVFACQKLTWPMDYEREEYEHKPYLNPFCDAFYSSGNPWIATFSLNTGKLTGHFGELEPCAKAGRTGYEFVSPIMYGNGKELLYSDGYSGTVHITDNLHGGTDKAYSAFAVDTAAFPRPDTAMFYTEGYANAYSRYYYRRIISARMDDERVYCIVKYMPNGLYVPSVESNDFTFVAIDRRSGRAAESLLPHIGGCHTLGFGLHSSAGRTVPFGLYHRDDGGYVVREWTGEE